eukprot:3034569-Ditylum_brightwellii.AAC.1
MEAIAQVIKGQDIQDGDAAYLLVKSLLKGDVLQVFQKEEESQEVKDGLVFTKCLVAVTKHTFPKKLNDYLVHFPVPDRVTAKKTSHEEFVDILEDRILYQWKLEFKKEAFNLSSSKLKEFLDVCVCLEEAELKKLLRKTIACAKKKHNKDGKRKSQDKPKLCHKRHHGLGTHHQGKRKKKFCNYHGLCYHGMDKCNFVQSYRKHIQPMHHFTEQQRLRQ